MGPNDQNSDRGIETMPTLKTAISCLNVRTTRIPTEELKPKVLLIFTFR